MGTQLIKFLAVNTPKDIELGVEELRSLAKKVNLRIVENPYRQGTEQILPRHNEEFGLPLDSPIVITWSSTSGYKRGSYWIYPVVITQRGKRISSSVERSILDAGGWEDGFAVLLDQVIEVELWAPSGYIYQGFLSEPDTVEHLSKGLDKMEIAYRQLRAILQEAEQASKTSS